MDLLTPYSPNRGLNLGFHSFVPFETSAARLLNSFFDNDIYSYNRRFVYDETEGGFTLTIELPGFKQSELDVTLENSVLTVSAKKNNKNYEQSVTIPEGVDPEKIDAKLEDGVLVLRFTKLESTKPRKITIK